MVFGLNSDRKDYIFYIIGKKNYMTLCDVLDFFEIDGLHYNVDQLVHGFLKFPIYRVRIYFWCKEVSDEQ